jgi:uncharacterized protein (TIGR03435 family)
LSESLLHCGRELYTQPSRVSLGMSALLLAVLLGAGGLIPGWTAIAQTKTTLRPAFEAASIRRNNPAERVGGVYQRPGRFLAIGVDVDELIEFAYSVNRVRIEGLPSWAKARSRTYTIQAVMPPSASHLTRFQNDLTQDLMLQSLLADRFRLKVHRATKLLPVYQLLVAKGGPKMKAENDADFIKAHLNPRSGGRILIQEGHYGAWGNSSKDIASVLQQYLRREVIDKTGLTGRYDFSLTWTPWQDNTATSPGGSEAATGGTVPTSPARSEAATAGTAPVTAASGPSIFTAVKEQLGLKLKPARAPVEVLVVDHVEPPTSN